MRRIKKFLKRLERKFFNLLRFDVLEYNFHEPEPLDANHVYRYLVKSYFESQPGLVRVAITKGYLFIKKAIMYVLRRILRKESKA